MEIETSEPGMGMNNDGDNGSAEPGPELQIYGENSKKSGPEIQIDGENSKKSGPEIQIDGENSKKPGPEIQIDGENSKKQGPEMQIDVENSKKPGPEIQIDGENSKKQGPEMQIDVENSKKPGPEIQIDGENSKKPGPEIQIDRESGSNEPEMEIRIGAVFSLATNDDIKQNETSESESLESRTLFTGSTVSADEDESLSGSKSDDTCVTHRENNVDTTMYLEHVVVDAGDSAADQYLRESSTVRPESPTCSMSPKLKVDASGDIGSPMSARSLNESKDKSLFLQPVEHFLKTKKTEGCSGYDDIITIKKFSYCYVKLFDVLKHRVIKEEVINLEKKNEKMQVETNRELTVKELKKPRKSHSRKKKPIRLTMKKYKKKKPIQELKVPTEAAVADDTSQPVTITDNRQTTRPSRKRKFNHNLFTDAVVFDSRGICNFDDHVIKKLEEEESKGRTAPTYGFRGSRPQVARTKKKLSRVRREDMPFISVKLDTEQIDKLDKATFSKEKVGKSISCLLDRRVRYYHNLQKMNNGSFRIVKNRSKSRFLKRAERKMKKDLLKEKSKTTGIPIVATTENFDEDKSTTKKKNERKKPTVTGLPDPMIPQYQQSVTHEHKGDVDMRALLLAKKPHVSNQNPIVLPVNVKVEPRETSSYDENKDTSVSDEARISLTGRYRKPSNKYNSFITNFERNWCTPKMSTKTTVKLEQPSIEMDIATDAETIVRQQHLDDVMDNAIKAADSGEMKYPLYKDDQILAKLPIPSTTVVESPTLSFPNNGDSVTCITPNVTTGNSTKNILPNSLKPVKTIPTLVMKPPSINSACANYSSSLFKSTVNELARTQNTKKFFQLRVGDKILLIPADGGNIVPKAYVIDIANNPSLMTPSAEKSSHIPDLSSKKSLEVSSKHVDPGSAEREMGRKHDSLGRAPASSGNLGCVLQHSVNQQVIAAKSPGGDGGGQLTINTGNVLKQALLSPPPLSPPVEFQSSLYFNSKRNPPVLSPKGQVNPEQGCDDAKPPVLRQECVPCDAENPNPSHMKSILPTLFKGNISGGESAFSGLPVSADGHAPPLIVVNNDKNTATVVVKKEPAHIRNFEGGVDTKDTEPRKPASTTSLISELQETRSLSAVDKHGIHFTQKKTVALSEKSSANAGSGSDNAVTATPTRSSEDSEFLPVVKSNMAHSSSKDINQTYPYDAALSSTSMEDQKQSFTEQFSDGNIKKTENALDTSFAAIAENQDNPQSEVNASSYRTPSDANRERNIFGIETVTHVPANETMVQERIRKLRERLRENQVDLDNARKTFRIKKKNTENDY